MANIKILGIAGSLRKGSFNKMALKAAQSLVPAGATLETHDLPDLPGFNQDNEKTPPAAVTELNATIRPAGDRAWKGKPVAIMGASPGLLGTARAQYHLRQCLVFLDMPAVNQPEVM